MNVIIIAVIALIVMVVLIAIFLGKTQIFSSGVDSCTEKGGECLDDFSACMAKGGATVKAGECDKQDMICCIVFEESGG